MIAVDECIPHILRIIHFLLEKGSNAANTVTILQDNQSAILLEHNDILSSSKRTKHINVRYIFVKQKINDMKVVIVWCPTDKLVGDFLSKPLSGSKFIDFRCKIMNITKLDTLVKKATCLHQTSIMNFDLNDATYVELRRSKNLKVWNIKYLRKWTLKMHLCIMT